MEVTEWMRKCIYQRSGIKNKTVNQLYVFVVSSVWHGFYLAYYVTFVHWFLQLYVQGLIFKYCRNGKSSLVKIYESLGVVGYGLLSFVVIFSLNLGATVPFMMLRTDYCIKYLFATKFTTQIILVVLLAIFSVAKPPKNKEVE